jgi:hypothetical protein
VCIVRADVVQPKFSLEMHGSVRLDLFSSGSWDGVFVSYCPLESKRVAYVRLREAANDTILHIVDKYLNRGFT